MRRNRKDNTKRERIIMIASSVFVLTALTMTGVYMQSKDRESENDGYTIDFSALESNVEDKSKEMEGNSKGNTNTGASKGSDILDGVTQQAAGLEDDLDYLPMEAGSGQVQIPGLTDGRVKEDDPEKEEGAQDLPETEAGSGSEAPEEPVEDGNNASAQEAQNGPDTPVGSNGNTVAEPEASEGTDDNTETEAQIPNGQEALGENVVAENTLHFSESDGLLLPLQGELQVLIPFSISSSVYFETLDHFKRSDAMVIAAPEGSDVTACAAGKVTNIFQDAVLGHAVTMDLGDGYQVTYGQLRDITVAVGSYVNAGDVFAKVGKTTKYFVKEGDNLYLQLTADGTAIDPSPLF